MRKQTNLEDCRNFVSVPASERPARPSGGSVPVSGAPIKVILF
jgi:hypothetical protein